MKDHVRDLYRRALVATGFRVKAAAQAIGVGRATLNRAIAADRTLNQP
jgi:transposase